MVDAPLRVAVVTPPFYEIPPKGYGGIEALCHILVEGLVRRGHDVTLIAVGQDHGAGRFIPTRSGECPEGQESDTLFEVTHAAKAAAILSDLGPDVVHD